MTVGDGYPNIVIQFKYLIHANVVTVLYKATDYKAQYKNFLVKLFPDDYGDDTPNLANYYLMEGYGTS